MAAAEPQTPPGGGVVVRCEEGNKLTFPDTSQASDVLRAWWGNPAREWEVADGAGFACTEVVQERMVAFHGVVFASNHCLRGDPAPGVGKVLLVELAGGTAAPAVPAVAEATTFATFSEPEVVTSAPLWVAFVRHAQAGHNVDQALLATADNQLTEVGRRQAAAASAEAAGAALRGAELVVTSPLQRALETTALLLGDDDAGVRVLVHQIGTERWSAPCDEGSPRSELLQVLPERMLRWEGWDVLPERWWSEPGGEDPWARAEEFIKFARARPEERIAFVGHGGFWSIVMGQYLPNCGTVYCDRYLPAP